MKYSTLIMDQIFYNESTLNELISEVLYFLIDWFLYEGNTGI